MIRSNYIFYFYLLIFGIVLFLISGLFYKIAPLVYQHTVYYCQEALHSADIALPDSTPIVLSTILIGIFIFGLSIFGIQLYKTKKYTKKLLSQWIETPRNVWKIGQELNIADKLQVVNSSDFLSFSYGLFNPKICVSLDLTKSLSRNELKAVLIHERNHINNNDPAKILLGQVFTSMFFFIPVLKDIHNSFVISKEVDADKSVFAELRSNRSLKSALTKVLTFSYMPQGLVAAFAEKTNLEERIMALTDKKNNKNIKFSITKTVISLLVLIGIGLFLHTPIYSVGNSNNHSYLLSTDGIQCANSCSQKIVTHTGILQSSLNYTPAK